MIETCTTNAGRLAFLKGQVQANHVFKIALYKEGATLGKATKSYLKANGVVGQGYAAKTLPSPVYGVDKDDIAFMDFPDDIVWEGATISARGCMIYDETLDGLALVIVDFGKVISSTNGPFTLTPETDMIRFK